MMPSKDRKPRPSATPGRSSAGPETPARRLLRTLDGVELWHIQEALRPGQKWPTIRYEVGGNGGPVDMFERPHEAWHRFQQLTHAPDKDIRPEPPPIDGPPPGTPPKARPTRRRRRKPS